MLENATAGSVARNFPEGAPDWVQMRTLDWMDRRSFSPVVDELSSLTHLTVVASDCVYAKHEVGPLLDVIAALVRGRSQRAKDKDLYIDLFLYLHMGALLARAPLDFRKIKGFLTNATNNNIVELQKFKAFLINIAQY